MTLKSSMHVRLREAWAERVVRWQVAQEQRVIARRNVQAGNYTNGKPMAYGDRELYRHLTNVVLVVIVVIAVLVGVLIALAVTGA